jgi:hypothetical protein
MAWQVGGWQALGGLVVGGLGGLAVLFPPHPSRVWAANACVCCWTAANTTAPPTACCLWKSSGLCLAWGAEQAGWCALPSEHQPLHARGRPDAQPSHKHTWVKPGVLITRRAFSAPARTSPSSTSAAAQAKSASATPSMTVQVASTDPGRGGSLATIPVPHASKLASRSGRVGMREGWSEGWHERVVVRVRRGKLGRSNSQKALCGFWGGCISAS